MPASLRAHLARAVTRPYDRRSPAPSDHQSQLQYSPGPEMDVPSSPIAPSPGPPPIADHPGMPTYAQYKRLEANYLNGLSPRKRDKALITQVMFDKIWDVLHQPDACSIETPQFRFWVRKMFTLGRPDVLMRGGGNEDGEESEDEGEGDGDGDFDREVAGGMEMEMPTAVVLHEDRPVAVMEQLYELFCYCHERSGHGGRDKTCAVIRQHYSWVPKELTAQFVKACPTCTVKRSGNPDMIALVQEKTMTPKRFPMSGMGKKGEAMEEKEVWAVTSAPAWPMTGGPLDPANPEPWGVQERAREKRRQKEREQEGDAHARVEKVIDSRDRDSGSHPRSKKWVSPLAKLPQEGWVLRGADSSPLAHVPASKKVTNTLLPQPSGENSKAVDSEAKLVATRMKLPPLTSALSNTAGSSLGNKLNLIGLGTENLDDTESLPPVLRQLQISEPVKPQLPSYLFQIDPVLLAFNYPGSGTAVIPAFGVEPPLAAFGISSNNGLVDLPPLDIGPPSGIARNATCNDALRNLELEGPSDPRILPLWSGLVPSTQSNGAFNASPGLGLASGSPLRPAPDRRGDLSIDFEMGKMDLDSPDRSMSSVSSSDSPGTPYSGTGSSIFNPGSFSFSTPVGCESRYDYGAPPFLLPSPTDEVGRELARTLSLSLFSTDDA